MTKPKIPEKIANMLQVQNKHTCCICRESRKHVIIHHIDRNPENNDIANLTVLCHDCHSRVSGDEGLGRRYTSTEVYQYKLEWEELCRGGASEKTENYEVPLYQHREIFLLPTDCHKVFKIDMDHDVQLLYTISADEYINVWICDENDYRIWLKTDNSKVYEEHECIKYVESSFVAPENDTYYIVAVNETEDDIEIEIDISLWHPQS